MTIEEAIESALHAQMKMRVDEEIERSVADFRRRLVAEADQMAVRLMRLYEIHGDTHQITIKVDKRNVFPG
jgi:hypothetical protein